MTAYTSYMHYTYTSYVYIYFTTDVDTCNHILYIYFALFQKITTDVLKKTCLHAKVFTSDSDSSDEMTFNKNNEKVCAIDDMNN